MVKPSNENKSQIIKNYPTAFIKKIITTNPEHPKYVVGLQELNRRGETPEIITIPDNIIEQFLRENKWQPIRPIMLGKAIPWLRNTAAMAIAGNPISENHFKHIPYKDIVWGIENIDGCFYLKNIKTIDEAKTE